MSYSEQLEKRNEHMKKADDAMKIYLEIAYDLFDEETGPYSMPMTTDVESSGICIKYHIDHYDYSKGTASFFVSKEKIESLVEKYKKRKRKEKLKKISNEKVK